MARIAGLWAAAILWLLSFPGAASAFETAFISDVSFEKPLMIPVVASDPQVGKTVVLSADPSLLIFVDTDTRSIQVRNPLPQVARAMAIDAEKHQVLVAAQGGVLTALDIQTGSMVYKLAFGFEIDAVCVSPDGSKAILLGVDGILRILDLTNYSVIREVHLAGKPVTAAFLDHRAVLVVEGGRDGTTSPAAQVFMIDPESGSIVASAPLTETPFSIAIDSRRGVILLGFANKGVLMNPSLRPVAEIVLPAAARGLAINPSTGIGVAVHREKALSVIDIEKAIVLTTLALERIPRALALDPARNTVVIAQDTGLTFLKLENPVPAISRLVPDNTVAASGGLRLSVEGERFVKESESLFGARKLPTTFESDGKLNADIQASDLIVPGNVPVRVSNPPPGGGLSNSVSFRILNALPRIEGISPSAAGYGGGSVELIVRGQNFLPNSYVTFNGQRLETHFVSSIVLSATVDLKGIQHPGRYPVMVTNPSQVSLTSNAAFLSVASDEGVAFGQDAAAELKDRDAETQERKRSESGKLTGRILNTFKEPVEGVLVQVKGQSAYTDSDGRFALHNVPAGKAHVMVHGDTAIRKWVGKEPHENFPTIPLTVDVAPNAVTAMPYDLHLHRQKNRNFVPIQPRRDSVLTDDEHPGVELKIPAGVNIIGWDGKRNEKISMRNVPPDRLPLKPLPNNANARSVYMFHFDKVGGGTADRPIPFKSPNDLGLRPGEKAVLWYYDESPHEGEAPNDWAVAGTGTVTADGRHIITDPGVGIPKFCCGATSWGGSGAGSPPSGPSDGADPDDPDNNDDNRDPGNPSDPSNPDNDPDKDPPKECGDPVNLATGYFMHQKIDYSVPGIIPLKIKRYYRSGDDGYGAFGKGTYFGYDWYLQKYPDMLRLIKPGNYQYTFSKQPDGTFANAQDPKYRGDVFYKNADNTYTLKRKNGWQYTFGTDSLLDTIKDPNGNTVTFKKLIDGNISQIVTPEGRQIDIQYYIGGRDNIKSITGPFGTVTYTYYSTGMQGQLKSVQYPDGTTIQYQYDSSGRMSQITENGNLEVTNEYDGNSRVIRQTHIDGGTYTFNYTVAGGNITETSMTTPNSSVTTWRFYDDSGAYKNGYVTKSITEGGTTTYDRQPGTNQILSVTDRLGREKSYTYYANGQVQTKTDSLGNTTTYEYEPYYGRLAKITDALGKTTTFTYAYDSNKRITQTVIRDALSNATTIRYNENGLKTSVTDANGNAVAFLYENAAFPTQVTQIVDPLGNANRFTYDTLGRVVRITDADGKSTQYEYDIGNRVTAVTDANGNTTRYTYNGPNLTQVMDPKGGTIQYAYDTRNRLIKMTDPLGREETYAYYGGFEITPTTGDNLKSVTDRKGQTTIFNSYDARNRVTRKTYHDESYTAYTYDEAGRMSTIEDSLAGTIQYVYNDFGCTTGCSGSGVNRISEESTPLGTIEYTYDALGRRASMTVAGEPTVYYSYYDNGWLHTISREINNVMRSYTLSYDNAGRRSSLTVPTAIANRYITSTYNYDTANRLKGILHEGPSSTIENMLYSYDATRRVSKYTRNVVQPLRPTATDFSHNAANEMLSLTREGPTAKTMTYDANGNLAGMSDACGLTTYTWDARNRLTGIGGFKSDCSPLVAAFAYDALNRRISKTINGTSTWYLYDGRDIIQEIAATGAKTNYVRTLRIDEPLTRIQADGTIRHYMGDRLGSVIALVDDNGAARTIYAYDPFGNVTVSGEASDNPFQYTGRENDGTGLYYYRARYYSPELQRFISRDPIGLSGGDVNFYRYVYNNPSNWIDPSGLFRWHGNWGGPGWAAGQYKPEAQLTDADGKVPPRDDRDTCYQSHDFCIRDNPCGIKSCDFQLARCLRSISPFSLSFWVTSKGIPFNVLQEATWFDTFIPYIYHR